jgi:hypothetical protein
LSQPCSWVIFELEECKKIPSDFEREREKAVRRRKERRRRGGEREKEREGEREKREKKREREREREGERKGEKGRGRMYPLLQVTGKSNMSSK